MSEDRKNEIRIEGGGIKIFFFMSTFKVMTLLKMYRVLPRDVLQKSGHSREAKARPSEALRVKKEGVPVLQTEAM